MTDVERAATSLARAFHDDPVFAHLVPVGAPARERRLATLFAAQARTAERHGRVLTSEGCEAVALWLAPGRWKATPSVLLRETVPAVRALRGRAIRGLRVQAALERVHPVEPHWYLHALGTDPAHQGRGLGSSALAPVLERCDADGVPAYLESSKHDNIPFYERHGFRVTGEVALPAGGPSAWPMWRDPRP